MRSARATQAAIEETGDLVVVGAGLSGLVCARAIAAAGARVVVLEARDHPGGRIRSALLGAVAVGGPVDRAWAGTGLSAADGAVDGAGRYRRAFSAGA